MIEDRRNLHAEAVLWASGLSIGAYTWTGNAIVGAAVWSLVTAVGGYIDLHDLADDD